MRGLLGGVDRAPGAHGTGRGKGEDALRAPSLGAPNLPYYVRPCHSEFLPPHVRAFRSPPRWRCTATRPPCSRGDELLTHAELAGASPTARAAGARRAGSSWSRAPTTSTRSSPTSPRSSRPRGPRRPRRPPRGAHALVAAYDPDVVCTADGDSRRRTPHHAARTTCTPTSRCCSAPPAPPARPKLVRLSHDNVASNAAAIADYLALPPTDRAVTTLPLHYCYGLSVLHCHLAPRRGVVLTDLSRRRRAASGSCSAGTGATSFAGRAAHLRPARPRAASTRPRPADAALRHPGRRPARARATCAAGAGSAAAAGGTCS